MHLARWILPGMVIVATACAGVAQQEERPAATAPPMPAVTRQPITVASLPAKAFGLAVGAQWAYETNRNDECVGRGVSKTARGAITETVTSAWQMDEAQVFELHVESCLLGERLERTEYYVALDDRLYRAASRPETLIETNGRGYEAMLLATWPVTVGQTFGGGKTGAWRVLDQNPVDWGAGQADACAHLQRRSTNTEEEIWFCSGVGIVRHIIRQFGQRINEEQKTLIGRTEAPAP